LGVGIQWKQRRIDSQQEIASDHGARKLVDSSFLFRRIPALRLVPPLKLQWKIAQSVLPLSFVYVGMICLTNMSMTDVSLTFYQVSKLVIGMDC
jgi:hypothetical protein